MCNFEQHIDWVNDLQMSKMHNLLFSCSNDRTINIWRIPNTHDNENIQTVTSAFSIHQYHKDYIKAICYNDESKILFACGYDGLITKFNIEEYKRSNVIKYDNNNFLFSTENNSIYSMDCDQAGKLLITSVYENVYLMLI